IPLRSLAFCHRLKSRLRRRSNAMETRVPRTKLSSFDKPRVLATLLFLSSLPGSAVGQTWKWTTETVDTDGVQTSIAVDQNQNLHISYFSGGVKYGFRP